MKLSTVVPCLALSLALPSTALAFDTIVGIGVGGAFQGGGNFFDKPGDQTLDVGGQRQSVDPEYPGFAGMTLGGGGFLDLRFIDYLGVEVGFIYTSDKGSAELKVSPQNGKETKYNVNIAHNAMHIPLLFKGVIPGAVAQPFLFVGPEFVIPVNEGKASLEVSEQGDAVINSELYKVNPSSYTYVTFGLGIEFKLPIPKVDIRIPLSLRGSINPGVSSKREERADYVIGGNGELTSVTYKTNWKFMAVANLGLSVYFDIVN